jgi:sulfide:quinone oxidoreductase
MRDNMKRILILGGGTAGSIVANKLARELRVEIAKDEVDIRILDKLLLSTWLDSHLFHLGI